MAKISLNDNAPKNGTLRVSLGDTEFDLKNDGLYETDNQDVIAAAAAHPFLHVEIEVPDAEQVVTDQNDPQVNPRADHLIAGADRAVVEKARKNQERIRKAVETGEYNGSPGELVTGSTEEKKPAALPKPTTEVTD